MKRVNDNELHSDSKRLKNETIDKLSDVEADVNDLVSLEDYDSDAEVLYDLKIVNDCSQKEENNYNNYADIIETKKKSTILLKNNISDHMSHLKIVLQRLNMVYIGLDEIYKSLSLDCINNINF